MKILRITGVFMALSIASMSYAEGPDDETSSAAFEFAFMVFDEFRITPEIGVVYEPILGEKFGSPKQVERREEFDDPTYKVARERILYDGIEVVISRGIDDPPSGWTWLKGVRIDDPKFRLKHGLRVGDPVAKFEETLGPWRGRGTTEVSKVSFYAGGYGEPGGVTHGAHATVTLELDDRGSVSAVDIRYWAD